MGRGSRRRPCILGKSKSSKHEGKATNTRTAKSFVQPRLTFDKSAGNPHRPSGKTLDKLNLHGHKLKEDYHRKVVEDQMQTVPGAHTSVVKWVFLLPPPSVFGIHCDDWHSRKRAQSHAILTSILALLWLKIWPRTIITVPRRGNPVILDPTHHIYTNQGYHVLHHEYKKAVDPTRSERRFNREIWRLKR